MVRYVLRRLLNAIPILIGITIMSFAIIHMAPGSPLSSFIEDPTIKAIDKENMIKSYGLDQPLYIQYWKWVSGMVQGDFGTSFLKNQPVADLLWDRLPNTLLLTVTSFIVAMLIAIPLGILCAVKVNSRLDQVVSALTFVGISIPGFWLGLLLIMFFAVRLGWVPSGGLQSINGPFSLMDRVSHLILPVFTIACSEVAVWIRYVRSSMLEVIHQDYMRTAKAKGLHDGRVLTIHGLRNALIPLATLFGLSLPGFFSGSVIVETIFSIPGTGRLFTEAAFQRDYPVIFAITTLVAFLYVLGSILADVSYAMLDPRVSLSKSEVKA
ncbi:ABC transporter permease [Paenibacillus allorhizosphaerae]|uniref:Glutathione transport system permease protein GsiC n=1 Tax=Paenibacillus allorhizosphaerae TaxID=2849866 RepID=A0ABM8VQB8_9BACL|nr:ABC transporter permease [Paenibacillus allorhizosphaerae]CAG7653736.1 Glutathione transport system permease protein GsiC [Paenibacillus allorhizosphaerae]